MTFDAEFWNWDMAVVVFQMAALLAGGIVAIAVLMLLVALGTLLAAGWLYRNWWAS